MTYSFIDFNKDLSYPLRLIELLGGWEKIKRLRPGKHPLAAGSLALKKHLAGTQLERGEKVALANLILDAKTIFGLEHYWVPHQGALVKELLKESRCSSTIFVLHVIDEVKSKVDKIQWQEWEPGSTDLKTEPPMVIECKLARSCDDERLFRQIQYAHAQHHQLNMAYVIAVGCQGSLTDSQANEIRRNLLNRRKEWLRDHPKISSVLLYLPVLREPRPLSTFVRGQVTRFRFYDVTEIRNNLASYPTPVRFNERYIRR